LGGDALAGIGKALPAGSMSETLRGRIRYDYLRQMLDEETATWEVLLQGIEEKKWQIQVWSPVN